MNHLQMAKLVPWKGGGGSFFFVMEADFLVFFLLFTASVRSRPIVPTLVLGLFVYLLFTIAIITDFSKKTFHTQFDNRPNWSI